MDASKKTFVLDTNIVLNDYFAPFRLAKDYNVVLPLTVIQELDSKKKAPGSVGMNARRFHSKFRDEAVSVTPMIGNSSLTKMSKTLSLYVDSQVYEDLLPGSEASKANLTNDLKILSVAMFWTSTRNVKLLTNDNNLLVQSIINGVKAESCNEYKKDEHFTGINEITIGSKVLQDFNEGHQVFLKKKKHPGLQPNQILILRMKRVKRPVGFALFGGYEKPIIPIQQGKRKILGLTARNKEQEWLMALGELLWKPTHEHQIDMLTIEGPAGCGKTLFAVAMALEMSDPGSAITLTKPLSVMGKQETGFLKGDLSDKMKPFMQSYVDILEKLDYANMDMITGDDIKGYPKNEEIVWDDKSMQKKPTIYFDVLSHIRGRNMGGIIVVDEAQNLDRHELKSLVTRADEGAKVILIADTAQIDAFHLDKWNNGFVNVTEKMKSLPFTAHIALRKCERSRLAKAAGEML